MSEHAPGFDYVVGRPMEILLVEDSLPQARLTIGMLKQCRFKHRVTLMRDGEETMEFLRQEGRFARAPRPDLILLDLGLPKKDGREVLTEIREDLDLKTVPVVVLTASESQEDKVRSEMLQVEAYMVKPIDRERFVALTQELKRFWHADVMVPGAR